MRITCFAILFFNLFIINLVYTQVELDSVNTLISESKNDSLTFEHLYSKIKILRSLEQLDSALITADEMIHLYIVDKENELKELKGDRLYLGISEDFNVTNYLFKINSGDTIYLCTDGFAEKRGGEKGKKYYYSQLRKTIQLTNKKPLVERSLFLKEKFLNWKGSQEQIDDVCIIGVTLLNS